MQMVEIGKYNTLNVVKEVDFGIYLDGGEEFGEILMPTRYVPKDVKPDDEIEVFIYLDSEDRIIATNEKPVVTVGEFAYLKVVSLTTVGAFLDWGLPKDILLPYREQKMDVEDDQWVLVYVYLDAESKRLVASSKVDKFLDNVPPEYQEGDEVDILVCAQTDIGFKAIINNTHWGVIYKNEVFKKLKKGEHRKAYIKKVRDDEKIDLSLQKIGYSEVVDENSELVLNYLKKNGGKMDINDKSSAEEISEAFGISKKSFKRTIGKLYKNKQIILTANGVTLS